VVPGSDRQKKMMDAMNGWFFNNLDVTAVLGWILISLWWANTQKGRLDSAIDRIKGCEDVAERHSVSLDKKLETMDGRLRRMGSQLDRLLGASGRRIDDHMETE
jgi:hypothetical protein